MPMSHTLSFALSLSHLAFAADGLPSLNVGDTRVILCTNGAFVAERKGQYLVDGGISYATGEWEAWGQQVRNARPKGAWERRGADQALVLKGLLRADRLRRRLLDFEETVVARSSRADFAYSMCAAEPDAPAHVGTTYHFPVEIYRGRRIVFEPGFTTVVCPDKMKKTSVAGPTARHVVVAPCTPFEFAVSYDEPREWTLVDDREFDLNTYRLLCHERLSAKELCPEEGANLEFSFAGRGGATERVLEVPGGGLAFRQDGSFEWRCEGNETAEGGLVLTVKSGGKTASFMQADRATGTLAPAGEAEASSRGAFPNDAGLVEYSQTARAASGAVRIDYTVALPVQSPVTHVAFALVTPVSRVLAPSTGAAVLCLEAAVKPEEVKTWRANTRAPASMVWKVAQKKVWGTHCHYASATREIDASDVKAGEVSLSFVLSVEQVTPSPPPVKKAAAPEKPKARADKGKAPPEAEPPK